jgi:ABC-type dipeptide/oligopeptide/nickel transport system permease subunit
MWRNAFWIRVLRSGITALAWLWAGMLVVAYLFAPSPPLAEPTQAHRPPSASHWLGTDHLGRDTFTRLAAGTRPTFNVTLGALVVSVIGGGGMALVAAGDGRWTRRGVLLLLNAGQALPSLVLALVVMAALGRGEVATLWATGIAQMLGFARLALGALDGARVMPHVAAAQALGATTWRVLWRHVLLNTLPLLRRYAVLTLAACLLNSAALSFLGLGGEVGGAHWGVVLAEARANFRFAPTTAIAAGAVLVVSLLAAARLAQPHDHDVM